MSSKDILDFSLLLSCIINSNLSSFSIFINLYDSGGWLYFPQSALSTLTYVQTDADEHSKTYIYK